MSGREAADGIAVVVGEVTNFDMLHSWLQIMPVPARLNLLNAFIQRRVRCKHGAAKAHDRTKKEVRYLQRRR